VLEPGSTAAVLVWENTWAAPAEAATGATTRATGVVAGPDCSGNGELTDQVGRVCQERTSAI
jgi:hypothetical protein